MAFILVREICADLNLHHKTRAFHIGMVKFTSFHDAYVLLFRCSGLGCGTTLPWRADCQQYGLFVEKQRYTMFFFSFISFDTTMETTLPHHHFLQEITTDSVRTWKTVCITFLKTFIHYVEDALIESYEPLPMTCITSGHVLYISPHTDSNMQHCEVISNKLNLIICKLAWRDEIIAQCLVCHVLNGS